jgi:hypothetical protein
VRWLVVVLAYPTATTTFSSLKLLRRTDSDKEIEILELRHQLTVLQRQVTKPASAPADRFHLGLSFLRSPDT